MAKSKYAGELWVRIKADMAQLRTGLTAAKMEIKSFSGQVAASSAGLRKFGVGIALVSGALAILQGLAVKTFAEFEQSLANTFSVLGAYGDEVQQITDYTRKMGETTIFTASQAADAMYYLASAGYDAEKSMSALKGTLDLAAATQYDLAETTRLVVTAINAFGLAGSDATRVANTFSAIISSSQATMDRLGDSFKYVAPIASVLGIGLEQTAAALGKLYNAGLAASQAGTYLRQGLIRLQKPTAEARKAMAELGLSIADLNPQTNDLIDIISALERVGGGAADAGDEMAKIFGVRAATAFQILVREGGTALSVLESKITGTNKASEMASIQINTLKGSMKLLKSTVQETAINIGQRLAPTIRIVAETLRNLFKGFNALPAPMKSFIINAMGMVTVIGLIIGPLAILLSFLPKIIAGISAIGLALSTTTGFIGLAAIAITGLIAVWGSFANEQEKLRSRFTDTMTSMNDSTDAAVRQKEKQYDLIKSYVELGKTTKKSEKQIDQQKQKFEQIKSLYPDLISATDTYTSAVGEMGKQAITVEGELKDLYEMKRKLRELELRIDTAKTMQDMNKLKKEMKDTSLGISQAVTAAFRLLGDDSGVELEILKEKMDELATTAEGMTKLENTMTGYSDAINISNGLIGELGTSIKELEGKGDKITGKEQEHLTLLRQQLAEVYLRQSAQQTMLGVYAESLEKGRQLLGLETKLKENQVELNNLKAKGLPEDEPPPEIPDRDPIDSADNQKKIDALLFELRKQTLEAQLALFEENKKEEIDIAFKYNDIKTALAVEQFKRDKQLAVAAAIEIGADVEEVKNSFADRAEGIQAEHEKNINDIKSYFLKKGIDLELNKLSLLRNMTVEDLKGFKAMLEGKLKETKVWGDDYVNILKKIKQIENQIFAQEENVIKLGVEVAGQEDVFGDVDEIRYVEQLEKHKEYLENRMKQETEFSKEWMDLQREVMNITSEIYAQNLAMIERNMGFVVDGLVGGFNYMWSKYIIGAREAADEMDAIWLAIRNSALRAIQQVVEAEITKLLLKLIGQIIGFAVAGPGGAVAGGQVVALASPDSFGGEGMVPRAQTGALVKKSGALKVHQNEVIVPAGIVRKNRDFYNNALKEEKQPIVQEIHNNFNIINPMVDDDGYWESVMENKLIPLTTQFEKRQSTE